MHQSRSPAVKTALRRFRCLPVKICLILVITLSYVALQFYSGHWGTSRPVTAYSSREDELRQYQMKEVDLDFIRRAGLVDHKIADLSDSDIDGMNQTELMVTVHSYLDNCDTLCKRRLRMGLIGEGGWEVCDDEGVRPRSHRCLVYSFGNERVFSFEDDVARVYRCEVHIFKASTERAEYNRSSLIHVHPYGVGRVTEITPLGTELHTFADIRSILNHAGIAIDLVKMDIENGEWSVLSGMLLDKQLHNIRQLLVEFHVGFPPNLDRLRRIVRVMRSLSRIGFRKFYVHKNPRGSYHHPHFPILRSRNYEIHFLNSKYL
ncbi:methyltransferase-like protein 24 [Biomphalaria glabrata]|uniref:Uncharacterized protein LOC106056302 n=1 Tax=Biomphalaria glabrata TaxID=6526 RepID=A0A2C9L522_BIOGL|nr:uncharacterized protein LOC106056302 [Biomphalaria glabrata]KAI8732707.1 methyltransferase-like protein 24 isoform X1 [Biomphalaria glabrata]KAI8776605.1 methyltransferase protein 24 isoform X1 [Biomphalaria glabrata]